MLDVTMMTTFDFSISNYTNVINYNTVLCDLLSLDNNMCKFHRCRCHHVSHMTEMFRGHITENGRVRVIERSRIYNAKLKSTIDHRPIVTAQTDYETANCRVVYCYLCSLKSWPAIRRPQQSTDATAVPPLCQRQITYRLM